MGAPRKDEKAMTMYELYRGGNSLASVARTFGVSRQSVYKMFKLRNLVLRERPKPLPHVLFCGHKYTLRNTGYYGRTRGARTLLHRDVWQQEHGEIPSGLDVHHRDRNRANNRLSNLALISRAEHSRLYPGRQNQHTKRAKCRG